ncbi:hypothetical protein P3T21_004436 [Paraburkholderia sp. GAS334]|jgi:hypothetical protein
MCRVRWLACTLGATLFAIFPRVLRNPRRAKLTLVARLFSASFGKSGHGPSVCDAPIPLPLIF